MPSAQDESTSLLYYENNGQLIDLNQTLIPEIQYYNKNNSPQLFFADSRVSFVFWSFDSIHEPDTVYRLDLEVVPESGTLVSPVAGDPGDKSLHYFLAHCPLGITDVPGYKYLTYEDVVPGVDWFFSSNTAGFTNLLRFDPNVDTDDLTFQLSGQNNLQVDPYGLTAYLGQEELFIPNATAYQIGSNNQVLILPWQPIFTNLGNGQFEITPTGIYDTLKPLIFWFGSPTPAPANATGNLEWSTYYGASSFDEANTVVMNSNGDSFYSGATESNNFPNIKGAYVLTISGDKDIFIEKYDVLGKPVWGTYYGGSSDDIPSDASMQFTGTDVYLVGRTTSNDFPQFNGITGFNGYESGFLLRLELNGKSRKISTYLGGDASTDVKAITVNENNEPLLVGVTTSLNNFTLKAPPGGYYQSTHAGGTDDGFIIQFNASDQLIWGTYFGTSQADYLNDISMAKSNSFRIVGMTAQSQTATSSGGTPCGVQSNGSFPDCNGGAGTFNQGHAGGINDNFITEFDNDHVMQWSTYLGGSGSEAKEVYLTGEFSETFYILGTTNKSSAFPIQSQPPMYSWYQTSSGLAMGYVTKFVQNRTQEWGTLFGSNLCMTYVRGGTVDGYDNLYVAGFTQCNQPASPGQYCQPPTVGSGLFPVCPRSGFFQQQNSSSLPAFAGGLQDGYIAGFDSHNKYFWGSYYGGNSREEIRDIHAGFDGNDHKLYIAGRTQSLSGKIPLSDPGNGAYMQYQLSGWVEGFLGRFDLPQSYFNQAAHHSKEISGFRVFPNPSNHMVTIELEDLDITSLELLNLLGQSLKLINQPGPSEQWDVSNYPAGVYLLVVRKNSVTNTQKIIIR